MRSIELRVLIAGGGTGGHVIPGLAIARELRDGFEAELLFVGTARGIETRMVPEAGFPLELVRSGQLKNVSLMTQARTLLDLPLGVVQCIGLLRNFRPDVVVGVGGYASGPAMLAALVLGIPMLAYEPNAIPGMTNRVLGKRVSAAAVSFEQTVPYFRNAQVTGVPVRPEIFLLRPRPGIGPPRLLVTAGSNGAMVFNRTMPRIIARLLDAVPGLTVVHQAGTRQLAETVAGYVGSGADARRWAVKAFLTDMPEQYGAADLVLARAGSTIAELCAAGRASLLVPLATAADDHQRKNAEVLVKAGAAEMMLQGDVTGEGLLAALVELLSDAPRRTAMAERARSMSKPGALGKIAAMVVELARARRSKIPQSRTPEIQVPKAKK